jgi:hypothetical protein
MSDGEMPQFVGEKIDVGCMLGVGPDGSPIVLLRGTRYTLNNLGEPIGAQDMSVHEIYAMMLRATGMYLESTDQAPKSGIAIATGAILKS